MTVTVSLVLVFALAVLALLRFRAVGVGAALLCALFGFYLANTDSADTVNDIVGDLAQTVSDIGQ